MNVEAGGWNKPGWWKKFKKSINEEGDFCVDGRLKINKLASTFIREMRFLYDPTVCTLNGRYRIFVVH